MSSRPPADDELSVAEEQQLVELLDDFERRLRGGRDPRIETYLERVEEKLQPHLLFDLVRLEQELGQAGRRPTVDEYAARFPEHRSVVSAAVRQVHGSEVTLVMPSARRVGLVRGTPPSLATETAELLQSRLRAVALVLCVGLGFFLARMWLIQDSQLVLLRYGVFVAALACALRLFTAKSPRLAELRSVEVILMVAIGMQTTALQVVGMTESAARGDALMVNTTMLFAFATWIVANMAYAVFIPNSWRRAAVVVIPAAAVPLLVTQALCLSQQRVAGLVEDRGLHAAALLAFVASGASIFGAYTTNALRKQAFLARRFGQYRLRRQLGRGGMGEVYLAEHELLKRPCAIKLIRPGYHTDAEVVARFEREVQATARLSHWNTIEIFDYGRTEDGTFYYVMQFLVGQSLQQLVERYGPLPPARVVYLLRQVCDGLAEAHDAGLIHQDVKPANIFAAHCGGLYDVAKLLDFGLVHEVEAAGTAGVPHADGRITGTPLYMAPEQVLGDKSPDVRTDIYALGATAYCLLTGGPVFRRSSTIETMRAHAKETPLPPTALRPEIPSDLEAVVLRCLAKRPEERFADVRQLRDALSRCECAEGWNTESAAAWWRDRQREFPSPPPSQ